MCTYVKYKYLSMSACNCYHCNNHNVPRVLPKTIFELIKDKLDWNSISQNELLTDEFVERYADKLNWEYISNRGNLSDEFIRQYADRLNWSARMACTISTRPVEFIKEFQTYINWDIFHKTAHSYFEFVENFPEQVDWELLSNLVLPAEFIRKYNDKLDLYKITSLGYHTFDIQLLRDFADRVNWNSLSNVPLPEDLIEQHQDEVDWHYISIFSDLSDEFITRFKDKVCWKAILKHQYSSCSYLKLK